MNEIPYLARIISVADAFDAMMSDRLYRSKLDLEEARNQLIECSGTQFDAEIVKVFINMLDGEGYGQMLAETAATYE